MNAYGPTECADDVTHQVVAMPPGDVLRIPIGRPIPGMTVHVLDERRQPVGAGEIGELWVGGIGVGRGYLHAAVQTADAFVTPDPFDGRPGTRLYRTGDRGRRRDDGAFEWLGRLDGQVKIHGMRIETEEVEVLLNAHPSVRGAVVMGHPSEAPTHLIAHVAGDPHVTGLAETLRRHLAERLPAAMVPSSFVLLDALPCTPNGKIDRRALAAPSASVVAAPAVDAHRRVPETPSERLLASLWREVLGVEVSSVDAGFFALGGDSLSTIRLVAVARRHGLVFSAQQVFEQPTLAGLAAVATTPVVRAAEQGAVVGEVPLTPIQRMLLVADLPDVDHYNMAMVLMVDERLCGPSLALAVEHLMRHHDVLRLRVVRDGDGWRARIAGLEGSVPHAHVDLSTASDGDAVAAIEAVAAELQASLRLGEGPILRVASFDLGAARPGRVLVIVHHLACDAASWPILLEDLATVYAQLERGEAIALPPKTTSYEAWARRLEDYAAAPERGRDRAYWRRECAEMGARLRRERDGVPAVADVARLVVELDEADTAHLLRAAAAAGVTMESVLLTALAVAVTKGCGEESVLVYLERHGRTSTFADLDVTRTVGWFTAVFPVCVRVADGHDAWATLAAVGRHLRGVPDGGLGWGAAAYGGNDTTAAAMLRGLPRPEVSLNFLGRVDPPRAAGWRRAPESPGPEVAPRGTRPTVLDVVGQIEAERLQVAWYYDALLLARALVEEHVETFRRVLRTLASPQASVGGARDAGEDGMNDGILTAIGNTPLVALRRVLPRARFRLFAKLEALNPGGSIKDRAAMSLLLAAMRGGSLGPDSVVVESSSGNMGIGLAQACSRPRVALHLCRRRADDRPEHRDHARLRCGDRGRRVRRSARRRLPAWPDRARPRDRRGHSHAPSGPTSTATSTMRSPIARRCTRSRPRSMVASTSSSVRRARAAPFVGAPTTFASIGSGPASWRSTRSAA